MILISDIIIYMHKKVLIFKNPKTKFLYFSKECNIMNITNFLIYNPIQIVQVVSNGEDFVRGSLNLTTNNLAILNFKENDPLVLVSIE
jgi:hypothetical protein